MNDLETDELVHELRRLYRAKPVHVSARELAEVVGVHSTSAVLRLLKAERRGLVRCVAAAPERRYVPT